MSNLVFDIEADGLDPTKIFCIVAQDVDTMLSVPKGST